MPGVNEDTAKFRRGGQDRHGFVPAGVGVAVSFIVISLIVLRLRAPATPTSSSVAPPTPTTTSAPPPLELSAVEPPAPPASQPRTRPSLSVEDQLKAFLAIADGNREITFAHLKKNAERYKGAAWTFSGRILEISEATNASKALTVARIALDEYQQKVMWVVAPFATEFVEGDRVDVTGILTGNYSYRSQAGWDITIPSIEAGAIMKRGRFDKLRGKRERPRVVEEDGTVRYLDDR